jgi:hypothetical protein
MHSASNIPCLCRNFPQRLQNDMITGKCFQVCEAVQDLYFFLSSVLIFPHHNRPIPLPSSLYRTYKYSIPTHYASPDTSYSEGCRNTGSDEKTRPRASERNPPSCHSVTRTVMKCPLKIQPESLTFPICSYASHSQNFHWFTLTHYSPPGILLLTRGSVVGWGTMLQAESHRVFQLT